MSGRTRLVLAIVVAVLVNALFFFFVVRAKQSDLGEVRDQVEAAKNETQSLQAELHRRQELKADAPKLQAELNRLTQLVPQKNEVPNFIFQVEQAANQSGVDFVQITPEVPKPPPEGATLAEVRTTVAAEGGFFAIQDLIRRLYSLDRAVRIDNFDLTATDPTGTTLKLTATARIFFDLPAGTAAAPATTTTTTTTTP